MGDVTAIEKQKVIYRAKHDNKARAGSYKRVKVDEVRYFATFEEACFFAELKYEHGYACKLERVGFVGPEQWRLEVLACENF